MVEANLRKVNCSQSYSSRELCGNESTVSIFSGVTSALGAFGLGGSTDTQPAAYLNYILFDQNYKLLTMGWTRVPAAPLIKHTLTLGNINIKEAGYIFVYLSYEGLSNNIVYFDDMKIKHTRSNVVQYNEYYPFGMQTANSWTRENTTGNNFLGNGGTELNNTSNLYDLSYRNYDPVLGRMNGVDPMAAKYASLTPYNFSFNDPVTFNDPSGADPSALYNTYAAPISDQHRIMDTGVFGMPSSSGGSGSMSFSQFINTAGQSQFGGSWSNGRSVLYNNYADGVASAMDYNNTHNSWNYTIPGSYEAAVSKFFEVTGVLFLSGVTIQAAHSNSQFLQARIDRAYGIVASSFDHWQTMSNTLVQSIHQGQQEFANNPFGGGLLAFLSGGGLMGAGGLVGKAALSSRVTSALFDAGSQFAVNYAYGNGLVKSFGQINVTSLSLSFASPGMKFSTLVRNGMLSTALEVSFNGKSKNILNGGNSAADVLISGGMGGFFSGLNSASRNMAATSLRSGRSFLSNGLSPSNDGFQATAFTWGVSKGISILSGSMSNIASDVYGNSGN